MHGNDGKQSKGMFFNTMLQLAAHNYSTVSCDARGKPSHMPMGLKQKGIDHNHNAAQRSTKSGDARGCFGGQGSNLCVSSFSVCPLYFFAALLSHFCYAYWYAYLSIPFHARPFALDSTRTEGSSRTDHHPDD
jgi:hypothetical protein